MRWFKAIRHRIKKSQTHWGFPYGEKEEPKGKEQGVAIMIALMTVMFMVSIVSDLILSSAVNTQISISSKDRVRSEYLAKSGLNLGVFLLTVSWGIDLFRMSSQVPKAFQAEPNDSSSSIWAKLNSMPPLGASSVDLLLAAADSEEDPFGLKGVVNEKFASQMRLLEDEVSIKIEDEAGKINLSQCKNVSTCRRMTSMLTALFSCPVEKAFLESKQITPEELAFRIKDFVFAGPISPESGFSGKNDPYQDKQPPYNVRETPFDSIDELKLVEGWDDDIHKVFSKYLTVYPYITKPKKAHKALININTAPRELMSCLIPDARQQECAEKFALQLAKNKEEGRPLVENQKEIKDKLKDLLCFAGEEPGPADPVTWFTNRSYAFGITVKSRTGEQERELVSMVRKVEPKEKDFNRGKHEKKRSYEILHWRLR